MQNWMNVAATIALSTSAALAATGCMGQPADEQDSMDPAVAADADKHADQVATDKVADWDDKVADRDEKVGEANQPCLGGFGGWGFPGFGLGCGWGGLGGWGGCGGGWGGCGGCGGFGGWGGWGGGCW